MKKVRKIWIGIGAYVLAGSGAATAPAVALDPVLEPAISGAAKPVDAQSAKLWQFAAAGEAGEAGEGGEAGINFETIATDPVEYSIALNVVAAHFHAGLLAYEGKETEAGAQMFAHGLSEVYVEMEPVLQKNGVKDLGKKLQEAVDAATEKKSPREIRRKAKEVLAALAAAEKTAPRSDASALAIRSQVTVEMIERAAAQYAVMQKDGGLESYLDGLGFAITARDLSRTMLPALKKKRSCEGENRQCGAGACDEGLSRHQAPGQAGYRRGRTAGRGLACEAGGVKSPLGRSAAVRLRAGRICPNADPPQCG